MAGKIRSSISAQSAATKRQSGWQPNKDCWGAGFSETADGIYPMNFCCAFDGRTLLFAVLISAVASDAFGISMGWLSTD
jgi:hypothetical protein